VPEAPLEDGGSGVAPADEGWFVVNARDAEWWTMSAFDATTSFESKTFAFAKVGINLSVIPPGNPNCLYHSEALQEDFLVLAGRCKLLVEGEERELGPWDFFHCPPGTAHVFVAHGDEPCVILMIGERAARVEDEGLLYPVSELAAKYGASADKETPDAREAYARFEAATRSRPAGWDDLPWSR
jgi:uncharacterized cupin superfamily protein